MKLHAAHELCAGCKLCQLACSISQFKQNNPKMTAIKVRSEHFTTGHYRVTICTQCGICAKACPVGAISMIENAYRIDSNQCTQCLACVDACPQQAMFTHPDLAAPIKCVLCKDCVAICPTKTLSVVD